LRAFARRAEQQGRPVLLVDGRTVAATPEAFLAALGAPDGEPALAAINRAQPLLLIDTFEELVSLERYLFDELFPGFDARCKVIVAGRSALGQAGPADSPWRRLVRPLVLEGLSRAESAEYLERRGPIPAATAEQIMDLALGNPLALALAADLVLQLGVR